MKELKRPQISMGAYFDSDFEIKRLVQDEIHKNYFLSIFFSVYHQENGRIELSQELKEKAQKIALDAEERGLPHPLRTIEGMRELFSKDSE
ncbi:hypothetical protein M1545_03065 [Patescibacteria group bacterium]|nr:hypothetical protein [Patescibacteria group bacterium]